MNNFGNPWLTLLGCLAIAGLILYFVFMRRIKRKTEISLLSKSDSTRGLSESKQVSSPSGQLSPGTSTPLPSDSSGPEQIFEDLEKGGPAQFNEAARKYQGTRVKWLIQLSGSFTGYSGKVYVIAREPNNKLGHSIIFSIDMDQYPQLQTLGAGQQCVVEGTIISVEKGAVNLDDCSLFFDETKVSEGKPPHARTPIMQ